MLQLTDVARALVIAAHPDDADFGAAGTVASLTDAGAQVTYCLVTDGQAGGFDTSIARLDMASTRRVEQTSAAAVVGVDDLVFLGRMDGEVEYRLDLRHDLTRVIRQVRPDLVISHSPQFNLASTYASHPDHVATGQAAFASVYPDARNPFAFPALLGSGFEPWSVPEMWIMTHPEPNLAVDISEQIDRKIEALRCHASQHSDPDAMEQRVRAWNLSNGAAAGLGEGVYAERFYVVDTR